MNEIIFEIREEETEGGFVARALGHSIVTQAETWEELRNQVRDAVRCHFEEGQPERINAYAQAVIRTLQADEHQRGCLMEERVLKGDLAYESLMPRPAGDEERFVLLAMHQTLVERGVPQPGRAKENSPAFHRCIHRF